MAQASIQVTNLGKAYKIAGRRHDTLRDAVMDTTRRWMHGRLQTPGKTLWALKDLNFEVEEGEVLGVVGRNGAGKSTLLKILSRITAPTEGIVRMKGHPGSLLEVGTGFHPELTGRENVFMNGAILGMRSRDIQRKFDAIVAFSEVEEFLDTPVKRYSSGMHMRLAFAVAAHLDTDILIVDEVLAVGDAHFQTKCLGKMGDVAQEGRTVLFVSHNMPAITRMCRRAILLENGRLTAEGESREVVRKYLQLYDQGGMSAEFPPDPSKAMSLRHVNIHAADGGAITEVAMGKGFRVSIEYDVHRPVNSAHIFCRINTDQGLTLLGTGDADTDRARLDERQPGSYRSTFTVPPFLIGEGRYSLGISMGIPYQFVYDARPDCIFFTVVDHESKYRDWLHGGRPGLLGVEIPWSTERKD